MSFQPKVRPLDISSGEYQGENVLLINDRLGLMAGTLVAPPALAVLLSLCDGTRDAAGLAAAYALRTGDSLTLEHIAGLIEQLDEALIFDSERYREAIAERVEEYRELPHRPLSHADQVYPADRDQLQATLDSFLPEDASAGTADIRGVISPHIDYARGGTVYAATWKRAAEAARLADVIVIFGTDHQGGPGRITMTKQAYATPYGVLPLHEPTIDAIADSIGSDEVYREELHHATEHSIELAAVWLHWALGGESKPIVPILCGSFAPFTEGALDPADFEPFDSLINTLRATLNGRRVLAIAAADFAHVGPAFGDSEFREPECATLADSDALSIATLVRGDAKAFFDDLRQERDQRKYCGLPPIYLLLRFLEGADGELISYDQCPADPDLTSWVSIAGMVLR